jgi:hypothetical protein
MTWQEHAAVKTRHNRQAHRRLSPLQKPAPESRTHAQTGGDVRASNLGRQSHQVIALTATGQLGVAAAGQIRLAVVTS